MQNPSVGRMTFQISATFVLFVFSLFAAQSPSPQRVPQQLPIGTGTASISGHVYSDEVKTPVNGAVLTLMPNRTSPPFGAAQPAITTKSRNDGSYTFVGVAAGSYAIQAEHPGFVAKLQKLDPIAKGQRLTDVNIQLDQD